MKRFTLSACLAVFAMTLSFAPAAMQAQTRPKCGGVSAKCDMSELDKKMIGELGSMVTEYWMPKLNDYKARIDRSLSAEDLETLNRLRVRFAILTSDLLKTTKSAMKLGGDANSPEATPDPADFMKKAQEAMEIYTTTKQLAARYRDQLDNVKQSVVTDVTAFAAQVDEKSGKFLDANRADIEREKGTEKGGKFIAESRTGISKMAEEVKSEKGQRGIAKVYLSALEPIVMLYNGADLGQIMNQLIPTYSKPLASTGITMPENAILKQNVPNPASVATKIIYNLPEASNATTIRLYGANGTIAASFDQGAQPAGQHERTIDVSQLPNGSYLCHLTVQTVAGERVFSRTMQVMR